MDKDGVVQCNKFPNGTIFPLMCGNESSFEQAQLHPRDKHCEYFFDEEVKAVLKPGIPGLGSGVFFGMISLLLMLLLVV